MHSYVIFEWDVEIENSIWKVDINNNNQTLYNNWLYWYFEELKLITIIFTNILVNYILYNNS